MIPPRLLAEFIGTFFLVLIIGLASAFAGLFAPVAVGMGLVALVHMGGPVSGAQYNPAVSIAFWLRGSHDLRRAASCIIAQFGGAMLGALMSKLLTNGPLVIEPDLIGHSLSAVLAAEVLFTFLMVLVILNVSSYPSPTANSYYGLAIGASVLTGAFCVGKISGAAFNPALGLGTALVNLITGAPPGFGHAWVYLAGPMAGAVLAALAFRSQARGD